MAITIINPNSTATMTDAMVIAAEQAAPTLRFEGWTSENGPPSIQGFEDGETATPHLLTLVEQAASNGTDGIIIGCFDDTALRDAAQLAPCPVIGIGQTAYHFAAIRNWRFSVVTTLPVSVPVLEANIRDQGLNPFLAKVRASDVPVLELESNAMQASQAIRQEAIEAAEQDDISAVILGCAGMVQVVKDVQSALSIEVIDPVACAARCMRWLV